MRNFISILLLSICLTASASPGQPYFVKDRALQFVSTCAETDLVAYWKFDSANDSSTYDCVANYGIAAAGQPPISLVSGKIGTSALFSCYDFNTYGWNYGLTHYIYNFSPLANITCLTNGAITWWYQQPHLWNNSKFRFMWSCGYGSTNDFDCVVLNDNTFKVGWYGNSIDTRLSFPASAVNFPQSNWVWYAYTWTATNQVFWTNSVPCASNSTAPGIFSSPQQLYLGTYSADTATYAVDSPAMFDEFKIYTNALTPTYLSNMYHTVYGQ